MIDSHCHLADDVFQSDLDDVIGRAKASGLEAAMCILAAEEQREIERAATLGQRWSAVRFAAGVHPHQAKVCAGKPGEADRLVRASIAAMPDVCAVGEIGLDYHYDFSPADVQREVFVEQLATARALRMPVVIHTREADNDTFDLLGREGQGVPGVFHCFTGGIERARRALDLGFHLSLAGILTFPKAGELREVARFVPENRLLVETDSPFLAPVPYRGKRNEPAWVVRVVDAVAEIRGASSAEIARVTAGNFIQLVGQPHTSAR